MPSQLDETLASACQVFLANAAPPSAPLTQHELKCWHPSFPKKRRPAHCTNSQLLRLVMYFPGSSNSQQQEPHSGSCKKVALCPRNWFTRMVPQKINQNSSSCGRNGDRKPARKSKQAKNTKFTAASEAANQFMNEKTPKTARKCRIRRRRESM